MNTGSMRTASSADAIQPGRTLYAVLPWRRTRRGEIKVLEFPTSPEALMALRSQAADAMIEDAAVAHGMAV